MPRLMAVLAMALGCGGHGDPPGPKPRRHEVPAKPDAGAAPALPRFTVYATAADALKAVLATKPRVLGFGEVHVVEGAAPVASAVERFTGLLDTLAPHLSDLVIETWISEGHCGKTEAKVTKDVPRETARPPETESELVRLASRARALGVQPQALTLTCKDYDALVGKAGQVDYEKMLSLLTRELLRVSYGAVRERDAKPDSRPIVAVYGGAIHNDLHPPAETRPWSYATQLAAQVPGYVEVDLYVPELVKDHAMISKEPWYPLLDRAAPDKVVLIERGPRSYVLLLQKGIAPAKPVR